MKQISLAILLLFVGITANAQSKFGTIDAEYILSQMPENAEINKNMEAYNQELQADLKSTITDYEAQVKDYQETSAGLTDEAKKEKESSIIELENSIKGFRQKASVMMQMKRNELTGPLYAKIDKAMKEVIAEEGYTQIFHAGASGIAFSRAEDDITMKVLKKLGIEPKPAAPTEAVGTKK
ncbi:OmpH family outer membrane protein [Christiangramia aquimixticola]|uniref:OmpH family outer membrane protein n=1 Tax=Christiangramia aquimixticola TaxID=1697558 RepID=UPI003AA9974B